VRTCVGLEGRASLCFGVVTCSVSLDTPPGFERWLSLSQVGPEEPDGCCCCCCGCCLESSVCSQNDAALGGLVKLWSLEPSGPEPVPLKAASSFYLGEPQCTFIDSVSQPVCVGFVFSSAPFGAFLSFFLSFFLFLF